MINVKNCQKFKLKKKQTRKKNIFENLINLLLLLFVAYNVLLLLLFVFFLITMNFLFDVVVV